jgi:hypothetical protein
VSTVSVCAAASTENGAGCPAIVTVATSTSASNVSWAWARHATVSSSRAVKVWVSQSKRAVRR